MNKYFLSLFYSLFIFSLSLLIYYGHSITNKTPDKSSYEEVSISPDPVEAFPYVIEKNSTLSSSLSQLEIPANVIHELVQASKPVVNLAQIHPGVRFRIQKNSVNELELIEFRYSAIDRILISKKNSLWEAKKIKEQVDIKTVTFSGLVNMNLWESAIQANMDPNLVSDLAEIFGWEVDFSREVRVNDRWRLTVEQKFVKGQPVGWGSILAAEYENAGTSYQAVLFRHEGEDYGYFSPQGNSLRKMFLKSPIKYGRVTSGFSTRRYHPILKIRRPHLGVDYGAPIGTPIRSIGEGTVLIAKYNGAAGKMIRIRHNSIYQTAYKHLNGFAKGIRSGARVQQGQIIGYVGNSGLSTGPHLHFEFYQSGRYIDPLRKKFPSADPIPNHLLSVFQNSAQSLLSELPPWDTLSIANKPSTHTVTN